MLSFTRFLQRTLVNEAAERKPQNPFSYLFGFPDTLHVLDLKVQIIYQPADSAFFQCFYIEDMCIV